MQLEERREALLKQKEDLKVMFMKVDGALELIEALLKEQANSTPSKKESKKKEK